MKRRLFSLLLTLAMLLSLLPAAHALGEEKLPGEAGYGFTYAFVSPTTIEITAYYGYEAEVTVPSTIDGYTSSASRASTRLRVTATPMSLCARSRSRTL